MHLQIRAEQPPSGQQPAPRLLNPPARRVHRHLRRLGPQLALGLDRTRLGTRQPAPRRSGSEKHLPLQDMLTEPRGGAPVQSRRGRCWEGPPQKGQVGRQERDGGQQGAGDNRVCCPIGPVNARQYQSPVGASSHSRRQRRKVRL